MSLSSAARGVDRRGGAVRLLVAGLALLYCVGAVARDGTAGAAQATPVASPDVPGRDECRVAPVEQSDLLGLLGGGGQASTLLTSPPTPAEQLPQGPPATEEEVAGITAATRELVACANLQDPFRLLALLTDDFKGALAAAALQIGEAGAQDLAGRFPVPIGADPDQPLQPVPMIPIRDARLLPDGRVGAILEPTVAAAGVSATPVFFVVFELTGDRWLVDDVVVVDLGLPTATPGA